METTATIEPTETWATRACLVIGLGYWVLAIDHFGALVWENFPLFMLAWALLYYGAVGDLAWQRCRKQKWGFGTWVYEHRWQTVFGYWVVPAILVQFVLVAWGFDRSFDYFWAKSGAITKLAFPTVGISLPLWPLVLLLWYVRDVNRARDLRQKEKELKRKDADIQQGQLNQLQDDFHKLQEWACTGETFVIRASALHQLGRYLSGEVIDARHPRENGFQLPTLELFKALLEDAQQPPSDYDPTSKNRGLKHYYEVERLSIVQVIGTVLRKVFAVTPNGWGTQFPVRSLLARGLRYVDLRGLDLSNLWLQGADLDRAKLQEATLYNAVLMRANLREADLRGANLRGTKLDGAKLERVRLKNANIAVINNPSPGFREEALAQGAVELDQKAWQAFVAHDYRFPEETE